MTLGRQIVAVSRFVFVSVAGFVFFSPSEQQQSLTKEQENTSCDRRTRRRRTRRRREEEEMEMTRKLRGTEEIKHVQEFLQCRWTTFISGNESKQQIQKSVISVEYVKICNVKLNLKKLNAIYDTDGAPYRTGLNRESHRETNWEPFN